MESNQKLAGIFPALVTPFDKSGHLDCERAGPLIERLIQAGVDGFYIGGSTGEGFLQSLEERKRFLKYVADFLYATFLLCVYGG